MSFTLPRVAGTAVLALAASALALPLAAPARAVGSPVEAEYFITDSDGDYSYELKMRATPNGTAFPVAGDALHDISDLSFSRDGSRLTYLQTTYNASGDPVSTQVVVRDVGGQLVRVVSSVLESSSENAAPSLSPDGSTVVWTNASASGVSLYKSGVGTGSATVLKAGYFDGVFLDGTTLLARNANAAGWASITTAGVATATSGITANAFDLSVSADGGHLAWAQDTSTSATSTSDVETATLSVASGAATIGSPVVVASGLANEAPAFSRDGGTLYFIKWDGDMGQGDVWSAPTVPDAGTPPAISVSTPSEDDYDVAIGTTDDGTAPAAATLVPGTLNGTAATVRWALPADADLSGVLITKHLPNGTVLPAVYVPAPVTTYAQSGLTLGATYTYEIVAVDRSGNQGIPATTSLTALLAAPSVADPTSATSAKSSFPVTFAASAPNNVGFSVDYLVVGTTTWRHWVTNAAGRVRTFGVPSTGGGVASTTSTPGTSYVFRVQIKDVYNNTTPWVTSVHAVVPFDQTKATVSGGTTLAYSSAYLGSYRQLRTTASYAKVTLTGNRLQVIGLKCTTCGKFAIYLGSTKLTTLDTYASSTKVRQVLYTGTWSTVASRTFTIRPLATSGRPNVDLDGFATRR